VEEEEVAVVEDDEVDHRGPVKIGGVLWVVSHSFNYLSIVSCCMSVCLLTVCKKTKNYCFGCTADLGSFLLKNPLAATDGNTLC
jgi:hypothetical protein